MMWLHGQKYKPDYDIYLILLYFIKKIINYNSILIYKY